MKKLIQIAGIFLASCLPLQGQTESIVTVETDGGNGRGVLIQVETTPHPKGGFFGRVVTAAHVVTDTAKNIKVRYHTGKAARQCRVLQRSESDDVAILWVWVPEGIPAVELAESDAAPGDAVTIHRQHSVLESIASDPTDAEKIYAPVTVSPGDSGSPVCNERGEVVGVILGGWFWYGEANPRQTWPTRASNVKPIRKLLEAIK